LHAHDPRQVGQYRLLGRLGAGGMGEVFLGESPGHRKVAVKLLRNEHAGDPQFRERFAREVAAAKMVGGFHTAQVVDADPDGDPPWLVTAYIPGPSLAGAVGQSGPLDADAVRLLGTSLAEGLAAIHGCGLVHRDLKPANIILADDGPRIIDFGVARGVDAADLTSTGFLVGTITYMSPEQVSGERVDARSDVFSLGGVLAYATTGRGPFDAPTIPAITTRITDGAPDLDGIGGPLRAVIEACLAKDPAARPTLDAVTAHLDGTPRPDMYVPTLPNRSRDAAPGAAPREAAPYAARPTALGPVPPPPAAPPQGFPAPAGSSSPDGGVPGRRKSAVAQTAVAAVIVAAGIGVAAYLLTSGGGGSNRASASGATGAATAPASPAAASANAVPARDIGRWTGKLSSDSGGKAPTTTELTVTSGTARENVGQATYPGLGCEYSSSLVSSSKATGKVTLKETVQSGPCPSEYVVLIPAASGKGLTDNVYEALPADGGDRAYTGHLSRARV
jgi:hypothetical protein